MSTSEIPTPPHGRSEDDVHCLRCGYNLRGLASDPIRCPECAHENVVADLRLSPERLEEKAKELARYGTCAALSILMTIAPTLAWTWNEVAASLFAIPITLRLGLVMMGIGFPFALWCVRGFRRLCHGRHGWKEAMMRYCAYGLLWPIGYAGFSLAYSLWFDPARFVGRMITQLVSYFGMLLLAAWIHRRIGRDARWLVQGRDPELDWKPWWSTPDGAELLRQALKERDQRKHP